MTNPFEDEEGEYLVLVNEEGQYSLWPAFLDIPLGWTATGPRGERKTRLAWIGENWTDMRPLSLVRQMEERCPHAKGAAGRLTFSASYRFFLHWRSGGRPDSSHDEAPSTHLPFEGQTGGFELRHQLRQTRSDPFEPLHRYSPSAMPPSRGRCPSAGARPATSPPHHAPRVLWSTP
jgi:MbtH protein